MATVFLDSDGQRTKFQKDARAFLGPQISEQKSQERVFRLDVHMLALGASNRIAFLPQMMGIFLPTVTGE